MSRPVRIWLILASIGLAIALFLGIGYLLLFMALLHWFLAFSVVSPSIGTRLLRINSEDEVAIPVIKRPYGRAAFALLVFLGFIWFGMSVWVILNVNIALITLCAYLF